MKTQTIFPLPLASAHEIIAIERIDARNQEQAFLFAKGLKAKQLIQLLEKKHDDLFLVYCEGKIIELSYKLARMIKVSLCQKIKFDQNCSSCREKGKCHG